jgi:para-aminobenzoate synthetase component 1
MMAKIPASFNSLQHEFSALETRENFIEKVRRVHAAIEAGRLYQLNLTAPLRSKTDYSGEKIFKNYFEKFPGLYKAFLPLAEFDLISFSPELFLRKQANKLRTQPIKGSSATDAKSTQELLASDKEEAELSMIVDLLRNDLNRLNPASAAVVKQHRAQMSLGYIQHTYSEIEIESDCGLPETLQATAPGGSISGCPKIESLMMISELETYRRQAYTGCHGWWKDNNFNIALSIRSFCKYQDQLFYHAGCGLVYDSVAEKEWSEFVMKTAHLLKA